jgi:formiminoglutamase
MSGELSSAAEWFTRLEPARPPDYLPRRPDDPRLGEVVEFWQGDVDALKPGRAVLLGFPQDEGVRRNGGRAGAAETPREIRRFLYRLTPWDGVSDVDLTRRPPLDLGDVWLDGPLERTQEVLGKIIGAILEKGAVPVVLGGGHETAYGHYLGYVNARQRVGIINIDAHLDVRPCLAGLGHSGSPFRQALEHPTQPLPGSNYVCLGAQPQSVSWQHWVYVHRRGGLVFWAPKLWNSLTKRFRQQLKRLHESDCHIYVTLDADAVRAVEVPGVSAPNPSGLVGDDVLACARLAGKCPGVSSFDLVEINPRFDRDGQSARWAALAVWHFLFGLASRPSTVNGASSSN